jgi:hypothetical protein
MVAYGEQQRLADAPWDELAVDQHGRRRGLDRAVDDAM